MSSRFNVRLLFMPLRNLWRFFVAHIDIVLITALVFIAAIQYYVRPQSQSYHEIQNSGTLRVLISDEPDSQYLFNNQYYGFEYELLATFARSLDVELELVVVPYGELFTLLDSGAGDIAVGGILDTEFVQRVSQPTIPWFEAKTTVVFKRGTKLPKTVEDFNGETILSSARYYGLQNFDSMQLIDDHRSEYELLNAVAIGENAYAISTDYRARNAKHYLPELNRSFILPDKVNLVWSLPKKHDQSLLAVLNQFLQVAIDNDLPAKLEKHYLGIPNLLSPYDATTFRNKIISVLPEYEELFRSAARKVGIDWTLLAAMSYQESHWSNDARSHTGVRGIMQITTATAEYLKIDDRLDISQTIDAAASYVKALKDRLPDDIKEPQRTWFAVGAYNAGYRHIREAYNRAKREGLESAEWNTIAQLLPRLYGEPFNQGVQARDYVERIQIFTDILRFHDNYLRDKGLPRAIEDPLLTVAEE